MCSAETHTDAHQHAPTQAETPPRGAATLRTLAIFPFMLAIRMYQVTLAPLLSGHCRFIPTCSNYALDAYREHGPVRGSWLTLRRLLRCHPFGGTGYDPVPPGPRSDGR